MDSEENTWSSWYFGGMVAREKKMIGNKYLEKEGSNN